MEAHHYTTSACALVTDKSLRPQATSTITPTIRYAPFKDAVHTSR